MKLGAFNQTRNTWLCESLEQARGIAEQGRGLLGRDRLEPGAGMLFENESFLPLMWMHMFFMRFPIDIVFLDKDNRVLRINHSLKPWRLSSIAWRAKYALELEAGAAVRSRTSIGDFIELRTV